MTSQEMMILEKQNYCIKEADQGGKRLSDAPVSEQER
jgi:hypothetical protein